VLVVVVIVVVVMVVHVRAIAPCLFEFLTTLVCLPASLAVPLDRVAQFIFCLVNAPFTAFVVIVRPHGEGRTYQADNRQQCYAKNSDSPSHGFSLKLGFYGLGSLSAGLGGRASQIDGVGHSFKTQNRMHTSRLVLLTTF
jgi:hypothetical protein